jgi:hypothetical protein
MKRRLFKALIISVALAAPARAGDDQIVQGTVIQKITATRGMTGAVFDVRETQRGMIRRTPLVRNVSRVASATASAV